MMDIGVDASIEWW